MSSFDHLLNQAQQPLSRKDFMARAGAGLAATVVGTMLPACQSSEAGGQGYPTDPDVSYRTPTGQQLHSSEPFSPPATVPEGFDKPIELEEYTGPGDRTRKALPTPLPPGQRIGYAVVGLGHLSLEELLPALVKSERSRPVALVSGSAEKMAHVARQYGIDPQNCFRYADFEKLAAVKECQAVYIVLPNSMHAEYTIRAAKIGKHVLCEKPMANSADECRAMIDACRAANVKLMVAYRIQYEPFNRYVREQLDRQAFGKPKVVMAHNAQSEANPKHWRHVKALAGGGALPDIGLYCLNTTRFLLGEEPTEVFAYQYSTPGDELYTDIEELMSWQMRFPSGVIANCMTDYDVHESRHYRVHCERGWLDMENAFAYQGQKLTTRRPDGPYNRAEEVEVGAKDQFVAEIDHFSECIREDKTPYTPGEEGLQDQIIMEAIYASARTGRPVKLPPVPKRDAFRGYKPQV